MKFGIGIFPTDQSASPIEVARAVEELGFESLWVSEHSHMPVATEFPGGGPVPRDYCAMLDPFVALTAAAAVTLRIRLGTAICLITQRDPINCAKSVSTLDLISAGRVELGIGAGWNEIEMQHHRTDPATRFRLMRERVEAMKVLWTEDTAEYHGRLVDFGPSWQWPKPVQSPHPPVLIGGAGPNVLKRVLIYGDGWMPSVTPVANPAMAGRVTPLDELELLVPELRQQAEDLGRGRPATVVTGLPLEESALHRLLELDVERWVLRVPPKPMAEVREALETFAENVRKWGGKLEAPTEA